MQKLKENIWAQLFAVYTRYLLGGAFLFASVIKIKGRRFTAMSGENEPFGTAFHFFETMYQSGIYWQFIGWGQLLAALLLLTQRYARLGAVVNFPIVLNVFVITISMDFGYTSVITGLMLLANTALLVWDWNNLRVLVNLPQAEQPAGALEKQTVWAWAGLAMFVFTVVYRGLYDVYDPFLWGGVCTAIGLAALLAGRILAPAAQSAGVPEGSTGQ